MILAYIVIIILLLILLYQKLQNNKNVIIKNKNNKNNQKYNTINLTEKKKDINYYLNAYDKCGTSINEITEEIINAKDDNLLDSEKNKLNIIKGNVYKYNYNDKKTSDKYYTKYYFNKLNNNQNHQNNQNNIREFTEEDDFILHLLLFMDENTINNQNRNLNTINNQNRNLNTINNQNRNLNTINNQNRNLNTNNNNQKWYNDPQNVHDSIISNTVQSHFNFIKNNNNNYENANIYLNNFIEKNKNNRKLMEVYQCITNRNDYITKINCNEIEFIKHIICRIELNKNNKNELYNILIQNMEDCMEYIEYIDYNNNTIKNSNIICATGVITKLISTFAHLDENGLGLLKTKQAVKNEIFQECSKIDNEKSIEEIQSEVNEIIENAKNNNRNESIFLSDIEYDYIKKECMAGF